MPKGYMVLYLDGAFQSYGLSATEKLKGTELFPSKSAVVGLLSCSLGYKYEQREEKAKLSDSLKMAVRLDRGGRKTTDFQNVSGGHIAVEALVEGKSKLSSENKLIDKEYLMDSAYTVVLEGDVELLKTLEDAIKNPKWIYSLGRYNCIPSMPIYGTIVDREYIDKVIYTDFTSLEEAISKVPHCSRYDVTNEKFLVQIEIDVEDSFNRNAKRLSDAFIEDTYIGTSSYGDRYVYNTYVSA